MIDWHHGGLVDISTVFLSDAGEGSSVIQYVLGQ